MKPLHTLSLLIALALAGPAWAAEEGDTLTIGPAEPMEVSLLRMSATSRCLADCTVRNAPYSAQRITDSVRFLADGNRISSQRIEKIYRDGQGRTRVETEWLGKPLIQLQDPVARMSYRLYPDSHSGIAMAMAEPPPADPKADVLIQAPASAGAAKVAEQLAPLLGMPLSDATQAPVHKALGLRQIDGLAAEGFSISRTTPAGAIGNSQPLVQVTETWRSRELGLVLLTRSTDPRSGERTTRVTELQRGEPSPALFTPAGYTVREIARRR